MSEQNHGVSPTVSVIMPVYNGARTLEREIESVRAVTLAGWELLYADDCSTDGSSEVLTEFAARDPRFRVFRTPANRGAGRRTEFGSGQREGRNDRVSGLRRRILPGLPGGSRSCEVDGRRARVPLRRRSEGRGQSKTTIPVQPCDL